jgi:hypothetical protein
MWAVVLLRLQRAKRHPSEVAILCDHDDVRMTSIELRMSSQRLYLQNVMVIEAHERLILQFACCKVQEIESLIFERGAARVSFLENWNSIPKLPQSRTLPPIDLQFSLLPRMNL